MVAGRFRGMGKEGVWSAPTIGRLVGVPVAFCAQTSAESAERSAIWRQWFLETLATLDTMPLA